MKYRALKLSATQWEELESASKGPLAGLKRKGPGRVETRYVLERKGLLRCEEIETVPLFYWHITDAGRKALEDKPTA